MAGRREFDASLGDRIATEYERTGRPVKSYDIKKAFFFAQIRALQTGKRQKLIFRPPSSIFKNGKWITQSVEEV